MKKNKRLFASGLRGYVVNTMWNHMLNIRIKRNIQVLLSTLCPILTRGPGERKGQEGGKLACFFPTRALTAKLAHDPYREQDRGNVGVIINSSSVIVAMKFI